MKRSLPRVAAVSFSCPEQFHYQGFNFNFALQKQDNSCLLADVMRLGKCSALPCRKVPHGPQMGCPGAHAGSLGTRAGELGGVLLWARAAATGHQHCP